MQIITNWAIANNRKACKWEAQLDGYEPQYLEIIYDPETKIFHFFVEEDGNPIIEESFENYSDLMRLFFAAAAPEIEGLPAEEEFENYCEKIKKEENV